MPKKQAIQNTPVVEDQQAEGGEPQQAEIKILPSDTSKLMQWLGRKDINPVFLSHEKIVLDGIYSRLSLATIREENETRAVILRDYTPEKGVGTIVHTLETRAGDLALVKVESLSYGYNLPQQAEALNKIQHWAESVESVFVALSRNENGSLVMVTALRYDKGSKKYVHTSQEMSLIDSPDSLAIKFIERAEANTPALDKRAERLGGKLTAYGHFREQNKAEALSRKTLKEQKEKLAK